MSGRDMFHQGLRLVLLKQYNDALECFNKAYEADPDNISITSNRIVVYLRLGKLNEAKEDALRIIKTRPNWWKGHLYLSLVQEEAGRDEEALKACMLASKLHSLKTSSMKSKIESFSGTEVGNAAKIKVHESGKGVIDRHFEKVTKKIKESTDIDKSRKERIVPISLLCGYLGAGKTTILNNIISQSLDKKILVIVNDMSEINVDSKMLQRSNINQSVIEFTNGCICCTLKDDLVEQLIHILAKDQSLDHIIIESSGISEPLPIIQSIYSLSCSMSSLKMTPVLRSVVTVVDGKSIFSSLESKEGNYDINLFLLLKDQIEFSNIVIINKLEEENSLPLFERIESSIKKINDRIQFYKAGTMGQIPSELILDGDDYQITKLSHSQKWLDELNNEHISETEKLNIGSCSFRSSYPFDAYRLNELLYSKNSNIVDEFGIVRSKGYCWISQDDRVVIEWSFTSSDSTIKLKSVGFWKDAVASSAISSSSNESFGDRVCEIVIIGKGLSSQLQRDKLIEKLKFASLRIDLGERGPSRSLHHPLLHVMMPLYDIIGVERATKLGKLELKKSMSHSS